MISFGKVIEDDYTGVRFKPGFVFHCVAHVPDSQPEGGFGLCVMHDGLNEGIVTTLNRLADAGEAPRCVCLCVCPGRLPATLPGGFDRGMRMNSYDIFSGEFGDLVVEEIIPWFARKYNLTISPSPDYHIITGGSSGGLSAMTVAWFRADYFRRVYMSSPSFLAMGSGCELPVLIRKCETKPLRIYMEYSENEPNDYFGSSYCAALESKMALEFAGYDFKCAYFPGEGHCSRNGQEGEALTEGLRFLWKAYAARPVRAPRNSPRVDRVVSMADRWKPVSRLPAPGSLAIAGGVFRIRDNRIAFIAGGAVRPVQDGFKRLTALALSCDKWRLYAADAEKGCVYAYSVNPDGSLGGRILHAVLHRQTDFETPGALSLCCDASDRVYAATEAGIQVIRPFGLVDVILASPDGSVPQCVAIKGDRLYVRTERGVYCRKIAGHEQSADVTAPLPVSYYD